jgi:hypothetical protein
MSNVPLARQQERLGRGLRPVVAPVPHPTSATASRPVAFTSPANAESIARLDRLVVEVALEAAGVLDGGGVVAVAGALEVVHGLVRGALR